MMAIKKWAPQWGSDDGSEPFVYYTSEGRITEYKNGQGQLYKRLIECGVKPPEPEKIDPKKVILALIIFYSALILLGALIQ